MPGFQHFKKSSYNIIRTVSKVQILITFQLLSLKILYLWKIKVLSMMNDELLKNFSISCNHAQGTLFSYELALRKYCEYFGMSLKELLDEAEEDENNGVKWKHSRLKAKISRIQTPHVSTLCSRHCKKRNELH